MRNPFRRRPDKTGRPRRGVLHGFLASLAAPRRTREERDAARLALRERILRAIDRDPGASPTALVAKLDVGWSTFYNQLKRLEAEGRVRTHSHGRRTFVYPAGMVGDLDHSVQRSLLVGGRAHAVASEIARTPGHTVASLATALDISPRVVYHHVRRLTAAGLVLSSLTRGYRDLRATERLVTLLRQEGTP